MMLEDVAVVHPAPRPVVRPYDEQWLDVNHAFQPGGAADLDSRSKATDWFVKHLAPTGK